MDDANRCDDSQGRQTGWGWVVCRHDFVLHVQIEAAFEELRSVVASVDDDYAKQMHASVSLKTKPENVGCLIGKQGQNIKQIEEETRARVRVERKSQATSDGSCQWRDGCAAHEEGEELQCVFISGDVAAVELATQMVGDLFVVNDRRVSMCDM